MKKISLAQLTKISFFIFLLSVPFSYVYSLNFLEINKSYTFFALYNLYFIDVAALLFIFTVSINLYWHKKSFLAPLSCRDALQCVSTGAILLAIFAFLSYLWSGSPFLSAFWGMRLLIMVFALLTAVKLIEKSDSYRNLFFRIFIAAGVIEGIIALGQFIFQRSLGLYFLGESHLGPDILGLARIDLLGPDLIRAYGTFPHPNVLGGFLLFTLVATYFYYRPLKYKNILLGSQVVGLGLTFSRTALLGVLIVILFTFCSRDALQCVSTWKNKKTFLSVLGFIIILSLFLIRSPIQRIFNGHDETINIRLEYAKAAYSRFIDSPILGRGWGTGPVELPAFSRFPFYPWEMQPVHNIYLLVLSDLGIVGLLIFLYFIYRVLLCRDALQCVSTTWKSLFIAYLFIGLLDHYLLTLPQGIFIFFASALLAFAPEQRKEKKPLTVKVNKTCLPSD